MKIVFVAFANNGNPYINLLKEAIEKHDNNFRVNFYSNGLIDSTLNKKEKFILHIHWPEVFYGSCRNIFKACFGALKLLSICRTIKKSGNKIIWTVHNYTSHNYLYPFIDKLVYNQLFRLADNFIVHTEAGREFLVKNGVNIDKINIVPHGNFIGYYGKMAEKNLTTSGIVTFLNLGSLRSYKGLDKLVSVFNKIKNEKIKLHIVGEKFWFFNLDKLKSMVKNPNIVVDDCFIPDSEIAKILGSTDLFIIAHRNFLSSGAVILALSYGLPVIAPNSGDMPYVIKDGYNGFLYNFADDNALRELILKSANLSEEERKIMSQNAINSVKDHAFDGMAEEILKIYYGLI